MSNNTCKKKELSRKRKRVQDEIDKNKAAVVQNEKKTRRKSSKKKSKKQYFTLETQNRIIQYQKSCNKEEKDYIYCKYIMPAFNELVHNLVSVYKFKAVNEDMTHLKSDCSTFLFEVIHKWNPEKGTKAFSYFNVVAKNWLTINSRKLLKNHIRSVSIEAPEEFTFLEKENMARLDIQDSPEELERKKNQIPEISRMFNKIEGYLKDEKALRCISAIKQLFDNIENLDYLNKRAVFVYLREISGLDSTELSSSLSTIRKHYRKMAGPGKEFDIF